MHALKAWPRFLLTFPTKIRLMLLVLCFLLCVGIHILTFPVSHNGSLLALPVGLAAWMFRTRGLLTCLVAEIALLVLYQSMRLGTLWWPLSFALFFWGGFLILWLIGSAIVLLRDFVDAAEAARAQAEQAQRQLAVAYEQQLQLNQLKNHFITNVNHELRTPLMALYGYLEVFQLVLQQQVELDRATHEQFLEEALRTCGGLCAVVNRVLDTLQFDDEGAPLMLEELSVAQVVTAVVEHIVASERRGHRVLLEVPEQFKVRANAQGIGHVLANLLSNAFKYSPPETDVVVSAVLRSTSTQEEKAATQVCISVQDSGLGIPQEEIPLLFGQFVRLKRDLAGTERGTGLGLYICKRLVEAMGGQIWVESSGIAGQGSRFCFTLPSAYSQVLPS